MNLYRLTRYLPILPAVYVFFFARRILHFVRLNVNTWYGFLLSLIPAVVVYLLSGSIFSMGFVTVMYFTGISVLFDLAVWIIRKLFSGRMESKPYQVISELQRSGVVPIVVTVLVLLYGYLNFRTIIRTEYDIETRKEVGDWKIVLLTDTHYDAWQPKEVLGKAVEQISVMKPDLVILGGDIVEDGTSKDSMEEVFELLGNMDSRYGVYYVYGNHDKTHYMGRRDYSVEDLQNAIMTNGITILQDETVEIDGKITLAGRDDAAWGNTSDRMDVSTLLSESDKDTYTIVADHQPIEYEECAAAGADLQVSGHTHAGQIWPVGLLTEMTGNLNYGLYHENNLDVIVSSGAAGWGYPIRTGKHCEYVVININQI